MKSIRVFMTLAGCLIVFGGLTGCGAKEEPAAAVDPAAATPSSNGQKPTAAPVGNQPGNKPIQATQ